MNEKNMKDLKTLDEINERITDKGISYVSIYWLKKEAIKWFERTKSNKEILFWDKIRDNPYDSEHAILQEFIKYFFNLEDLK